MAHVSGPTSGLPGSHHVAPGGQMCDEHPDRPAVTRLQGETDSMGAEFHDLCQECLDKYRIEKVDTTGQCDWCKASAPLFPRRDSDEGMSGPVYDVCRACIKKDNARLSAELERYDDY